MPRGSGSFGSFEIREPEDLDEGTRLLDVSNDAVAYVHGRGVTPPAPPAEFHGEMPADITSLDDDELGDHLNKMSQYVGFVENELAIAQTKFDSAKAQYEFLFSRVRMGVKTSVEGKLTDRDKTDMVITDPRIVQAQAKVIFAEASYRLIRNIRDQAQRNWDTISRRITQRGQEVERLKRENNVAGVQAFAPRRFNRPGQQ